MTVAEEPVDPGVSLRMSSNRGRDTSPEMRVRRALHKRGLRYRVNARPIPTLRRTADVLFPRERIAVMIDGCFWHGCAMHLRPATKRAAFWNAKVQGNRLRDEETNQLLTEAGWLVLRAWEHEEVGAVVNKIVEAVTRRRCSLSD